jgi:hypothetical protein
MESGSIAPRIFNLDNRRNWEIILSEWKMFQTNAVEQN